MIDPDESESDMLSAPQHKAPHIGTVRSERPIRSCGRTLPVGLSNRHIDGRANRPLLLSCRDQFVVLTHVQILLTPVCIGCRLTVTTRYRRGQPVLITVPIFSSVQQRPVGIGCTCGWLGHTLPTGGADRVPRGLITSQFTKLLRWMPRA